MGLLDKVKQKYREYNSPEARARRKEHEMAELVARDRQLAGKEAELKERQDYNESIRRRQANIQRYSQRPSGPSFLGKGSFLDKASKGAGNVLFGDTKISMSGKSSDNWILGSSKNKKGKSKSIFDL
jgi:hypothetical protein